jgi:hypothetical protein
VKWECRPATERDVSVSQDEAAATNSVAISGESEMANDLQSRVDSMFNRDRLWAWAFVVVLWAVLLFVYFAVSGYIQDGNARILLAIAGLLVGVFNTASIAAMISHYGHDKKFIYELDIKHLDANR